LQAEDLLAKLMAKQQELLRMRQAISELRQLHDGEPEPAPAAAAEEEEEEKEDEEEGAEDEAALLQELLQKRAELQRMQAAIQQLESLGSDAFSGMGGAYEDEKDEEDEDEDEEDDDDEDEEGEPKTEEEWLAKLDAQQQELARLRATIASLAPVPKKEEDIEEEEEIEEEDADEEEEGDRKELEEMLAKLQAKRAELGALMQAKAELQSRLDEAFVKTAAAPAPPPPTARSSGAGDDELRAILMHRQQAQNAVEEQERKIAQLTALQAELRGRLSDLQEEGGAEKDGGAEEEEEEEEGEPQTTADADLAERVLMQLARKTDECQQLAAVVEEARAAGMDPQNPRLQLAERSLATRYQEIKELAAFAHRLGLDQEEEEEDSPQTRALVQRQSAAATSSAKEAFEKVQRLEQELAQCVQELRSVDANASEAVARHPAFRRMRAAVVEKLETLHAELVEARSAYEKQVTQQRALMAPEVDEDEDEDEEQHDLSPMLRAALDKLWQRPYDCRIFTLQLLQSLAQLDDQSLCMMTSCFARYLDNHSEPA